MADLLVSDTGGYLIAYTGSEEGLVASRTLLPSPPDLEFLLAGQFGGDRSVDVVYSTEEIGVAFALGALPRTGFIRGDANGDGTVDIADCVWLLTFLVHGGPRGPCDAAADGDGSGGLEVTDAIYVIWYRFFGGPPPPEPFPDCGPAVAGDLGCAAYPPCGQGSGG